tara:strand:- start:1462 stop:2445 length:984 start_codon:yes stop_codon:yes gene_type:complete
MGGVTYAYDKSWNMVPAAQVLNIQTSGVEAGSGWFDITDYKGNTLRFSLESGGDDGATPAGVQNVNNFTDYRGNPGNGGLVPPNITQIDVIDSLGNISNHSNNIATAINSNVTGFGQFDNTIIAIGYNTVAPASGDFLNSTGAQGTSYSVSNFNWNALAGFMANFGAGQPVGNGFINDQIDPAIAGRGAKVLIIQNHNVKINNTLVNAAIGQNWSVSYQDGNNPISFENSGGNLDLFASGEAPTFGLVGGKYEKIKGYFPMNASIDATYIGNSVTGNVFPGGLNNGNIYLEGKNEQLIGADDATHHPPGNLLQALLFGASWSADSPG